MKRRAPCLGGLLASREQGVGEVGHFGLPQADVLFLLCVGKVGGDLRDLEAAGNSQGRTQEEGKVKRHQRALVIWGLHYADPFSSRGC